MHYSATMAESIYSDKGLCERKISIVSIPTDVTGILSNSSMCVG